MTRCLVVEDEDLLGDLLVDNLVSAGFSALRARDGHEARALLTGSAFDLIVLDLMLPGVDGFTLLQELRARGVTTPVLILSARAAPDDRVRGLELQADDYLTKPFHLPEFLLRCRALLRRTGNAARDEVAFGGNRIDFQAHTITSWRGEKIQLTPSELALLRVLVRRAGEVIDRRELIDEVFGPSTPVKHRTLDNLVASLRRHLEQDSKTPRHLHTVRGVGLRLVLD